MNRRRHNIGDKVIALNNPKNSSGQPRKKGQIYTVEDVKYCVGCGLQAINIGPKYYGPTRCGCGVMSGNSDLWYTDSSFFAKPQELEQKLEEAVEAEEYELAHELHQLI